MLAVAALCLKLGRPHPQPAATDAEANLQRSSTKKYNLFFAPPTHHEQLAKTGFSQNSVAGIASDGTPTAESSQEEIDAWLKTMAATDPARAAAWIESLTDESLRDRCTKIFAEIYTFVDAKAALAWAQQLPDVSRRTAALESVCMQLAKQDPAQAVLTGWQQDLGERKTEIMESLTQQWANKDVSAALTWARTVGDDTQRGEMISRVVFALAQTDPPAAANLVAMEIPAGDACNRAAVTVVARWAMTDPQSSAAWVSQFPDGMVLNQSVENLIDVWAVADPNAANNWIATLPAGEAKTVGETALLHTRTENQ